MLSIFIDSQHQFTGYEHTRIIDLLTLLGIASLAMWVIVMLCVAARHIAILWFRYVKYSHRRQSSSENTGDKDGN